jgi:4-alpha-glucanotransferase
MEAGQQRKAGILMPVYALPGPEEGGTFGPESYAFIDFLAAAGQRVWQILPLVPTGREYSPYRGLSAFGGNPVFISLAALADKGWLQDDELPKAAAKSHRFDFRASMEVKMPLLKVAFDRFSSGHKTAETRKYQRFCHTHKYWLDNVAQFLVLADREGSTDWTTWAPALRDRDANAMDAFSRQYSMDIEFQKFVQYLFLEQWLAVKHYALSQQVDIFGDLPIFVDHESADVWAYPHLFSLDGSRRPKEVAGVPPDYFSETG